MTINDLITHLQKMVHQTPSVGEYKALAKVRTIREWGITEISHFRIQPMVNKSDSFVVLSGCDSCDNPKHAKYEH